MFEKLEKYSMKERLVSIYRELYRNRFLKDVDGATEEKWEILCTKLLEDEDIYVPEEYDDFCTYDNFWEQIYKYGEELEIYQEMYF